MSELDRYAGRVRATATLTLLAAVWIAMSPWVLGEQRAPVPAWDQVAVGGLLVLVAALRLAAPTRLPRMWWAEFTLGLWTICAGFLLGYPPGFDRVPTLWNHILCGAVVLALAASGAAARDDLVAAPRRAG